MIWTGGVRVKKFSYGYILSVVSAVIMLLQAIGLRVNVPYVNEVVTAVLGVLVALGIISGSKSGDNTAKSGETTDGNEVIGESSDYGNEDLINDEEVQEDGTEDDV